MVRTKTKTGEDRMIEELWMCAVAQGYCDKYGSISIEVFMDLMDIDFVQKWEEMEQSKGRGVISR